MIVIVCSILCFKYLFQIQTLSDTSNGSLVPRPLTFRVDQRAGTETTVAVVVGLVSSNAFSRQLVKVYQKNEGRLF